MGPVHGFDEAAADPTFASAGLIEQSPMPDGRAVAGVGPWNPSLGETPEKPAPQLGEHTAAILEEFGIRNYGIRNYEPRIRNSDFGFRPPATRVLSVEFSHPFEGWAEWAATR